MDMVMEYKYAVGGALIAILLACFCCCYCYCKKRSQLDAVHKAYDKNDKGDHSALPSDSASI